MNNLTIFGTDGATRDAWTGFSLKSFPHETNVPNSGVMAVTSFFVLVPAASRGAGFPPMEINVYENFEPGNLPLANRARESADVSH